MTEKYSRLKSVRVFARDVLAECVDGGSRDVVAHCSDGEVYFSRFYLGLISPVLFRVLNSCLYSSLPEVSLILPEFSRNEVKRLKRLQEEANQLRSSLTEALAVLKPGHKLKVASSSSSPLAKRPGGAGTLPADYYETIPDISNLDSLDIFDPTYLEDVEIQNEDNLSLTIHSTDVDLLVPPQKKSKSKKSKVSQKPKSRRKEERKENQTSPGCNKLKLKVPRACVYCQGRFDSKALLDKHLREQCTKTSFSCSSCDKSFKTEAQMTVHLQKHENSEVRKLFCQFCTKSFKNIFQLQNHLRIHSGERPFICHTCGKDFNQEATLRIHLRIHSGLKPHVCGDCGEAFVTGNSLLSHKQWKHTDGSRPFHCSFCSKSFPTRGAVKKHETIHTHQKKHNCDKCDKKFARADHLKSHMRSHQSAEVILSK